MRAAGDLAKMLCGSFQLRAIIEAGIEGVTHVGAHSRRERHMPDPGRGADEVSEGAADESATETSGTERAWEAERVGGIG